MTLQIFLMHIIYIGVPLILGFFAGMKYANRHKYQENQKSIETESKD